MTREKEEVSKREGGRGEREDESLRKEEMPRETHRHQRHKINEWRGDGVLVTK